MASHMYLEDREQDNIDVFIRKLRYALRDVKGLDDTVISVHTRREYTTHTLVVQITAGRYGSALEKKVPFTVLEDAFSGIQDVYVSELVDEVLTSLGTEPSEHLEDPDTWYLKAEEVHFLEDATDIEEGWTTGD